MSREELQDLVFKLRKEGNNQVKIGELLCISQARVSQILNNPVRGEFAKWGGHLQAKLNKVQQESLIAYLEKGAEFYGFEGQIWNSKRVKWLIKEKFGVDYHKDYIPTFLRMIGFSRQKPQLIDIRRDEKLVASYVDDTLPKLKKSRSRK